MRLLSIIIAAFAVVASPVSAGSAYLAFSAGSSFEHHKFDVWNGPSTPGRRALTAQARSSDYAVAFGLHDLFRLGNRSFDAELEIFERQNADFTATGAAGAHPTAIRTTSVLASVWTQVAGQNKWTLKAGAGIGARHSIYRMQGPGIGFTTTDRAPYAMIGLRLSRQLDKRIAVYSEIRAHTRPPIHSPGGPMQGPLEHNSGGVTLRMGLQIALGK